MMPPLTMPSAFHLAALEYFAGERRETVAIGAVTFLATALWLYLTAYTGFAQALVISQQEVHDRLLAERGGFEPPVELLTLQRFSKYPSWLVHT